MKSVLAFHGFFHNNYDKMSRVYVNENVCIQIYDEPKGSLLTRKTLSNLQELLFDV